MYCEKCGSEARGRFRCGKCAALFGSVWVLAMAVAAWAGAFALFLVVSKAMYPDVVKMFDGLGMQPPLPSRVYFALSALALPVIAAAVTVALLVILARSGPRLPIWSRRYALAAVGGLGWGLLAVALWWLCIADIIHKLS